MAKGHKQHLHRVNAPKHWMLDKMGFRWAPRPSAGPHKLRECLPLALILRNRLNYALTYKEINFILGEKHVKVDGKVRTDPTFPAGFMDVVSIEKSDDLFRLLYDTKGRFMLHRIKADEAEFKLSKVKRVALGPKGIPYLSTADGRTVRYPNPAIKVGDTVKVNVTTGEIVEHVKFGSGNLVFVHAGNNRGRIGILHHVEKHPGNYTIVSVQDATGNEFVTRESNVTIIGNGNTPLISLPKDKGVRLGIEEDRQIRLSKN